MEIGDALCWCRVQEGRERRQVVRETFDDPVRGQGLHTARRPIFFYEWLLHQQQFMFESLFLLIFS